jgi:hypothetical protein
LKRAEKLIEGLKLKSGAVSQRRESNEMYQVLRVMGNKYPELV